MTDRIKVLRIIARLNIGGPALHVTNLSARLDPDRYESLLVCGTESNGEGSLLDYALARGVHPIVIPGLSGDANLRSQDLAAFVALHRLIRRERPAIVHTHTGKAGLLGRTAARLAGVPIVVHTYHGHVLHSYYGRLRTGAARWAERGLAPITDRLIAVSERVKQDLVSNGVAAPERFEVIPLGLELDPFLDTFVYRGKLRGELGVERDAPLVGIVGRIVAVKNHRLFLKAAAKVALRLPAARFVIVGDGCLRPETERYARALGISDRTIFTGWRRDLPVIYADLDVLVVSSNNEGTPVSAIEAMAAGCPVVATRVGGLPDLIAEGETGHLVEPGDPEELAATVLRLCRDRSPMARISETARLRCRARFSVERLVRDVDRLYRTLLIEKHVLHSARTQAPLPHPGRVL